MGEPEKADEWHFEFRNVEENLTNVSPEEMAHVLRSINSTTQ